LYKVIASSNYSISIVAVYGVDKLYLNYITREALLTVLQSKPTAAQDTLGDLAVSKTYTQPEVSEGSFEVERIGLPLSLSFCLADHGALDVSYYTVLHQGTL
jgi:hypothetical protein